MGNGRVLMEPDGDRAADPADRPGRRASGRWWSPAGVGYGAAVLAACGVRVTALEAGRGAAGRGAQRSVGRRARGATSWPVHWPPAGRPRRPYDIVLIEGAVAAVPPAIVAQLRQEAGRLVTVIRGAAGPGQAVRGEATQAGLQMWPEFDCATPPIPALLPPPAFSF